MRVPASITFASLGTLCALGASPLAAQRVASSDLNAPAPRLAGELPALRLLHAEPPSNVAAVEHFTFVRGSSGRWVMLDARARRIRSARDLQARLRTDTPELALWLPVPEEHLVAISVLRAKLDCPSLVSQAFGPAGEVALEWLFGGSCDPRYGAHDAFVGDAVSLAGLPSSDVQRSPAPPGMPGSKVDAR